MVVTRSLHGVIDAVGDSVASAFTPKPQRSIDPAEVLKELEEVRRATRYHRERVYREALRRRRAIPGERAVRMAVLEALNKEERW